VSKLSFDQWVQIGNKIKTIDKLLVDLYCDQDVCIGLTKKVRNDLYKSRRSIIDFKSGAHNELFKDLSRNYEDPYDILDGVFYKNKSDEEPEKIKREVKI